MNLLPSEQLAAFALLVSRAKPETRPHKAPRITAKRRRFGFCKRKASARGPA